MLLRLCRCPGFVESTGWVGTGGVSDAYSGGRAGGVRTVLYLLDQPVVSVSPEPGGEDRDVSSYLLERVCSAMP